LYFKPPNKAVILSEALRRSIANRELNGAESKDLGDAYLVDAVRTLSTTEARTFPRSIPSSKDFGTDLGWKDGYSA
jgi:hypothetical protein